MRDVIRVEALKLRRSPVGSIATAALVGGTLAVLAGTTAALASGNPELRAKMGPAATRDWTGLLSSATQITAVGGLLGFGVVLAWMFAREFADGTITGLFGLPVGRGQIALAKFVVYGLWAIGVSVALAASVLILGALLGYGAPDVDALTGLGRQVGLGVLTAAIATPTAWVATAARSLLAGVGAAIGLVVITQVGVLAGAGAWLPPAAPAVWAMSGGIAAGPVQLGLAMIFALAFAGLAARSWVRLQLNR